MTGFERHAWLIYAFLTLFLWGYFSPQLTSASKVFGLRALAVNGGIMFLIGIVTLFFSGPVSYTGADLKNLLIGFSASALGYFFFNLAFSSAQKNGGSVNVVVVIGGMWLAIAVIRNWRVLGEAMTPTKWLGVAFAVLAVVCISLGGEK